MTAKLLDLLYRGHGGNDQPRREALKRKGTDTTGEPKSVGEEKKKGTQVKKKLE